MPAGYSIDSLTASVPLAVHAQVPSGAQVKYRADSGDVTQTLTPSATIVRDADEAAGLLNSQIRCNDGVTRCPVTYTPLRYRDRIVMSKSPDGYWALDDQTGFVDLSGNDNTGTGAGGLTAGGFVGSPIIDETRSTDFNGSTHAITTTLATRRNLWTNPKAANDLADMTNTSLTTFARSTSLPAGHPFATTGVHAVGDAANDLFSENINLTAGVTYTFSTWIYIVSLSATAVKIEVGGLGGLGTSVVGQWVRISKTVTAAATAATQFKIAQSGAGAADWYATGIQVEQASAVGNYFDGDGYMHPTTNTWVSDPAGRSGWTGTANASASDYGVFANGTRRTFFGWANRDTNTTNDVLVGGNATNVPIVLLEPSSQNLRFYPDDSAGGSVVWSGAWPGNGVWTFWELDHYPGVATTLYINGAPISTQVTSTAYNATPGNFEIGAQEGTANPFDGKQAHVGVFFRGLSDSDRLDLYQRGLALT